MTVLKSLCKVPEIHGAFGKPMKDFIVISKT